MGRSLTVPSALPSPNSLREPPGDFQHGPSRSKVSIFWKDGVMHHRVDERGLSADYPISYAIGDGKVGRSYLIELAGHLFQSPASFFTAQSQWNVSPGYESSPLLDFSRAVTADCLFCHTANASRTRQNRQLAAISCDRCHGSAESHLRRPVPGSIVNPAKLTGRERDSICEQCHLEGATTVLNPGKDWSDFHPGEALEQVETTYVYRAGQTQLRVLAVSHAEQLALSACLRGSGGKLWCGTCHNPHGSNVDRKAEIKAICESCHSRPQLASTHSPNQNDCIACHMPARRAADISHAAVTDHRILKRPSDGVTDGTPLQLVAWHEPAPGLVTRNLGLALFNTARQRQSVGDFRRAFQLLSSLPDVQNDPEVSAAEGYILLGAGQPSRAVEYFKRCVSASPSRSEYSLDLGVAEDAAGNSTAALDAFLGSISQDPYDFRAYKALANFYKRSGQLQKSRTVVDSFLMLIPQSLTMRSFISDR